MNNSNSNRRKVAMQGPGETRRRRPPHTGGGMKGSKQEDHATAPSYVRARRVGEAKLARWAKARGLE